MNQMNRLLVLVASFLLSKGPIESVVWCGVTWLNPFILVGAAVGWWGRQESPHG